MTYVVIGDGRDEEFAAKQVNARVVGVATVDTVTVTQWLLGKAHHPQVMMVR